MDIGIGLPNTIPGTDGKAIAEWARRAEAAGFSTLGVIDRLVYPNIEPLVALSAAAAVTERIKLTTAILIAPYRENAAVLAKQAASLQAISNGRLVLGMAVGGREDDYEAAGVSTTGRGKRFDAMLDEIGEIFAGAEKGFAGAIGPDVSATPPKVIIGGGADAAFRRAAAHDGWIMGGGPPQTLAESRERLLAAWSAAGRDGTPYCGALAYYALGPNAAQDAERNIGGYYAWLGDYASGVVDGVAKDAETVQAYVKAFTDAGADELILFPSSADPEQVDLLAAAVL
jgi:alkanesulfonate monooxygenase SsuD/methylene tetrahydromethanopterin reductase-like flavin-dependent oxidoreductase (luciferase family)